MSTRYLEFDSTYRNRNLYPLPSDFVVDISQSGQSQRNYAKDPISNASPLLYWNNSFLEDQAGNSTASGGGVITVDTTFSPTDLSVLKITLGGGGNFRQVKDFYTGAMLSITVGATPTLQRIVSYEPINLTTAIIKIASSLSGATILADGVIQNPTPIPTNTASSVIKFFIPTGSYIDNYYYGFNIQTIGPSATSQSLTITAYDGTTKLATLSSATISDWSLDVMANSNFIIRKELPLSTGTLTAVSSSGYAIQLASTLSNTSEQYNSYFLRMILPIPTAGGGYSNTVAPYSQERKINSYIAGSGTFSAHGGVGTNTFTLDIPNSSSVDNFYVGALITDVTTGETREVATYNGTTRAGTVTANWGAGASGDAWLFRTAILASPFSTNPVVGVTNLYELEQFTRDNCTPFAYTGSLVSVQEMVCYEVELINLVLPNITLKSGRGGRPVFYPYFYVELQQVSASSSGLTNILYSNNPNSTKMLFRAIVDDTSSPLITPFIKIDSDSMTQTVKFRPTDSFHFAVKHASGQDFETVMTDTFSPQEPNPLVQISACFAFKRI